MDKPTLQSLMNQALPAYQNTHRLSSQQHKVCHHIQQCRTPALGGLQLHCDQCSHQRPYYHACRDRHCPKCQRQASEQWCERQQENVLPVSYHHLVFTLPHTLNGWVQHHPEVIYSLLFQSVWGTLKAFGEDPKRLGGQLGMTAVLHTWGQNLSRHVHLHCLVPGGVFNRAQQWESSRNDYLFPVRALSRHFRGRMVSGLRKAVQQGQLRRITRPGEVDDVLNALMAQDWVVYSKPCLMHANRIVEYLGRYTHRIALSDARLKASDGDTVTLSYKDYADHNRHKTQPIKIEELIRRYLMHVLPKGFMRVRHYGFLANACRVKRLRQIRAAIGGYQQRQAVQTSEAEAKPGQQQEASFEGYPCPKCREGIMRVIANLLPERRNQRPCMG
jgi:hypothetical protein